MSKTEDVIKALNEGKDTATIKAETGASEALISRCRQKLKKLEEEKKEEEQEEEPTDEEIDSIIKRVKITPDQKYFTGQEEPEEEYHCMGCDHRWNSKKIPTSCPKCESEF